MPNPNEQVFVASPVVYGQERIIASPFQFLFTGEDNLRVQATSSVETTCFVNIRFLKRDGTIQVFQQTFLVPATRTTAIFDFRMDEGFILNLFIVPLDADIRPGEFYAAAFVIRGLRGGLMRVGQLLGGYCANQQPVAWPGSPIIAATEGKGVFRVITLSTEFVGTPAAFNVPSGVRWAFLSVRGTYDMVNSQAAAGPFFVGFSDGTNWVVKIPLAASQPADSLREYYCARGSVLNSGAIDEDLITGPLPIESVWPAEISCVLSASSTVNNTWKDCVAHVQQWLDP